MKKAVLFDLFETLVTEFADGKRRSGRNYDYIGLLGLPNDVFKQEWGSRSRERMTGAFADYPAVVRDILDKRLLPYNDDSVTQLYQERIKEKKLPFETIDPKVLELLSDLKRKGYRLGLVSNCTEEEVRAWPDSPLAPFFDDVLFSYDVGMAKPDSRLYRLACERLGVLPAETAFVGDGGSSELEGAHQAGLTPYHAVWFNPYVRSEFPVCASPLELKSRL